jgi:hypothetical protein
MAKLSQAGRLTLIDSVLQALSIYYMGAQLLSKTVIKQLESFIRRFFWGKMEHSHYLAYTTWDRICEAKSDDGLGLRNLETLNEAMILKAFWLRVTKPNNMWVQICTAKYLRESECTFWTAAASPTNSTVWKKIIQIRDTNILQKFTIKMGSRENTQAVGTPWFPGWQQVAQTTSPSRLRVADLWDTQNQCWNATKLQEIFDQPTQLAIVQYAEKPMGETGVPDLTVWKETKSGQYTVKTGYTALREGNLQTNGAPHAFWTIIWSLEIIPRVAFFYGRLGREHYQFKVFYTGE